jgi:hypothetical protein
MLLTAAFLTLGQAATPAADFSLRLEYGVCTTDVLDTFQSVFVRDLGGRVPALSIPLMVPQRSLDVAFQAIVAAQFFDYPTDFRTTPTSNCTVTPNASGGSAVSCSGISGFAPADHYRLTVRNAGVTHTASWQDSIAPSTEQANRLRTMLHTIIEMIRGLPEVQGLPLAQVACG